MAFWNPKDVFDKAKDVFSSSGGGGGGGSALDNPQFGTAAGLASAGLDYFSAKSLQDDSQSFSREAFQNQHQWRVADLKAAGLNPILAAHQGTGMTGAGTSSASPGATFNSARRISGELKVMKQTEKTAAALEKQYTNQAGLIDAQHILTRKKFNLADMQNQWWGSTAGKLKFKSDMLFNSAKNIRGIFSGAGGQLPPGYTPF